MLCYVGGLGYHFFEVYLSTYSVLLLALGLLGQGRQLI